MKIAILSDIHSNVEALRAVLHEIDALSVDKILFLGDYIGYYYNANIVLDLIKSYDKEMIKGNHELFMKRFLNDEKKSLAYQKKYGSGIEYAKKLLSTEQISYLINLPEKRELEIDGLKILMCHGSPRNVREYIYPNTSEEIKNICLESDADFVFIGHSHYSFIYEKYNKVLMNVGSVGQNRNVGGIANWGFLDIKKNIFVIKKTSYDIKPLIDQAKKIDPNHKYLVNVLNRKPL